MVLEQKTPRSVWNWAGAGGAPADHSLGSIGLVSIVLSTTKSASTHSQLCCSCCHKNSKIPSHYSSSQITSLAQNYATHTIQNSFTNLQITSVQQTFLHFWSSHHTTNSFYTRSSAVVTLQRPSNPSWLKISDRSFYLQAPALWNALPHHLRSHSHSSDLLNLILFSHYLLLNSTSSWKLTFFFIPILLSLSSLYWTDPLELWFGLFVIHYSFHILHPRSVHLLNSF